MPMGVSPVAAPSSGVRPSLADALRQRVAHPRQAKSDRPTAVWAVWWLFRTTRLMPYPSRWLRLADDEDRCTRVRRGGGTCALFVQGAEQAAMRVLHLAFEDHRRVGSGGGSLRNHEINSRLVASGFSVDVVTAGFARAQSRVEDGVRYRHVGLPVGYAPSLLSYQACLPAVVHAAVRRSRPDLVVEEFAPLTSSLGVGHWTGLPTVGSVQGFFARDKAREYHLPASILTAVERWGARSHPELIAVSASLQTQLQAVAPNSTVTVVPNGVDVAAAAKARARAAQRDSGCELSSMVYLGRLEIHQKGLDYLIQALGQVDPRVRLVVAGAGKDSQRLRRMVAKVGLSGRVEFLGPVSGEAKWNLIASADAVVQPSRFETFGMTVLEAMACGTPVIATNLECIRELVHPARDCLSRQVTCEH